MQRISITNPQNIIDGTAKKYYFKLRNTGGPKGDKGDKGDTGATGPQGAKGDPCTVVVNSTATLEPGSSAYVTNTGSLSNAVLNFGIPKGDRGPQGAKGDKGDTGAQGETGPRGPQGERGTNATVYVGTTSTLAPGSQATVYNSGTDSNAVLNFGIPQGAKGDTGSQGPQGATGPAGQNFAPTIVAELPTTGDESKLYLTPKAHTTSTATGNPVTASVTEQAGKMESFQLDGDTFQQTYTGKNIFDYTNADYPIVDRGITATLNSDGSITVTGKPTASYIRIVELNMIDALEDGATYTISSNNYSADVYLDVVATRVSDGGLSYPANSRQGAASFTVNKSTYSQYRISINTYTTASWGDESKTITRNFQLEKSATATSFEPYVGGTPSPNPEYPQPIQTVTGEQTVEIVGKNLFNSQIVQGYYAFANGNYSSNSNAYVTNKDKISVTAGATYTISANKGVYGGSDYTGAGVVFFNNGTYVSSILRPENGTFTVPSGANQVVYNFYKGSSDENITPSDIKWVQLELGSTATAYAPYSKQILPINLGKNLLNTSLGFQYGFIDNSGAYVSNNTIVLFNQYIEVSPATEYRFSSSHTNSNMTAVFYDSNKTFISRILVNTTSVNNFTTPINCRYVRLQANYNATEMSQEIVDSMDLMLSAGSQATTYAPYKTPIELCKLGNYQDYIYKDGDSWKVHKATKKLILDGSEEWLYYNGVCQLNSITDYAISNNTPYCGAFSGNSNVAGLSAVPENSCCFIRVSGETTPRFYVRYESKFSSVDAISQYLTTNPTSLYYALATATDTTITDTALIAQLEAIRTASLENGANTISNTATGSNLAGDMEIGYYGYNPTNRYDKWLWLDLNNNYEQIGS